MARLILVLVIFSILFACSNRSDKEEVVSIPKAADTLAQKADPTFKVDSFDVVFYKKPFTDKERYTRFFKVSHSRDSLLIKELNELLLGTSSKQVAVRDCMSEGKIILPLGGDAFRTIYFSREAGNCSYIYFIKDGEFHYFPISERLIGLLNSEEKKAVEP